MANFLNWQDPPTTGAPMSTLIPLSKVLLEPVTGVFASGGATFESPTMGQLFPSTIGAAVGTGTTTGGEAAGKGPDDLPEVPNVMDDEFEEGLTIDTGKWTARLVTTLTTQIVNGAVKMVLPATVSTVVQAYGQAIPAGNCAFVIKRIFEGTNNNFCGADVTVERGTGASRKTLIQTVGWNSGARIGIDRHSTDSDTFSATVATIASLDEHKIRMPFWLMVEYSGTNINFYYSWNGRGWVLWATEAEATWLGGRADRITIGIQNGSGGAASGFFEYFRRVA